MSNTEKPNAESERSDKIEKKPLEDAGGDGYKKKGGYTSSTRWGQENLSSKDCGQNPDMLRSPGERELSGYDDNTTTVGQPGDRKHLTVIDRVDDKLSSEGRQEESNS